jgi:hypothetical protein
MALGRTEGGEQAAPLGRAVIGGLAAATLATLVVLPAVFAMAQGGADRESASLDPDDPESPHYHEEEMDMDAFHAETQRSAETQRGLTNEPHGQGIHAQPH